MTKLAHNQNMDALGIEPENERGAWMSVYTGGKFFPLDPKPEEIFIGDIAHALSLNNRFNGHTKWPYSVAQHSVLCAKYIEGNNNTKLAALLHDATEAYIGDMIRPIKFYMQDFKEIEHKIEKVIMKKFGVVFDKQTQAEVKTIDNLMCSAEKRDLHPTKTYWFNMPDPSSIPKIEPWGHSYAKGQFMRMFNELYNGE